MGKAKSAQHEDLPQNFEELAQKVKAEETSPSEKTPKNF